MRMELPLYSAVVCVVRHRALLEHIFFTIVCRQHRFNDEFEKMLFFLEAEKRNFLQAEK